MAKIKRLVNIETVVKISDKMRGRVLYIMNVVDNGHTGARSDECRTYS